MYSIFLIHRTTSYDNKELKNIYAKEIENKDETNEELLRVEQIRRKKLEETAAQSREEEPPVIDIEKDRKRSESWRSEMSARKEMQDGEDERSATRIG